MPDNETPIRNIAIGDIFLGQSTTGASLLCQARTIDETTIGAQRLFMSDVTFEFDRTTGLADSDGVPCRIYSVAPLPPDILEILLALDHRHRTSTEPGRAKLSDAEKHALRFTYNFYRENPIESIKIESIKPGQPQAEEASVTEIILSFWRIV
jgi:hypothetical protein